MISVRPLLWGFNFNYLIKEVSANPLELRSYSFPLCKKKFFVGVGWQTGIWKLIFFFLNHLVLNRTMVSCFIKWVVICYYCLFICWLVFIEVKYK